MTRGGELEDVLEERALCFDLSCETFNLRFQLGVACSDGRLGLCEHQSRKMGIGSLTILRALACS